MRSNWTKYRERLQAVANNKSYGGSNGVALIMINCFVSEGVLLGWYKPQRIPLEPREFNISLLKTKTVESWPEVIGSLIKSANGTQAVDKTLVVKDAIPMGWLE